MDKAVNTQADDSQVTATDDSATSENKELEVVRDGEPLNPNDFREDDQATEDAEDDSESTDKTEDDNDDSKATDDSSTAEDDSQGEDKPLAPKSENRFQKLANENRELKERLDALSAKEAQVASEQELLGEVNPETGDYYTISEAERAARIQANEQIQSQLAQQRYDLEVQQNQITIANEANQALSEFPELDSSSDKYDAEIAQEYDAALRQALILDENTGQPIGAYMSPYQLAKSIAGPAQRAAAKAEAIGQANAQKATEKMLANVDNGGNGTPVKPSNKDIENMTAEEYAEAHNLKKSWN